tara:strand:+ start:3316 stop:4158 length:843 start_codon:yes stop_codon:yes gene_type:complete
MFASDLLGFGNRELRNAGIKTANLDARVLLSEALELKEKYFFSDFKISKNKYNLYQNYIKQRLEGKPVSKIIYKRAFWKSDYFINENVLDPRPDSETIIETAIKFSLKEKFENVLDLGTGSGCLITSIIAEFPLSFGVGVDISFNAIKVASRNSKNLNLDNRIQFIVSDWFNSIKGKFDLIVCNPPYIESSKISLLPNEVKLYDPHGAIDGGIDGLNSYRTIASEISQFINPNGKIIFEIGFSQEHQVINIMKQYGFINLLKVKDLSNIVRCLVFCLKNK